MPPVFAKILQHIGRAGRHQKSLRNCDARQDLYDPRKIAVTILPGHGLFIAEKWVPEKQPFQLIWEAMDKGELQIVSRVPQGVVDYQLARARAVFRL